MIYRTLTHDGFYNLWNDLKNWNNRKLKLSCGMKYKFPIENVYINIQEEH
jgi:hypothetical protein